MDNIRFLTEILMSDAEYWCARKQDEWASGQIESSVWLICIPQSIRRNLKKEEILLTDLEKLRSIDVNNIALSEDYPPFQIGTSLYNFTNGFPVTNKIKQFMIDALALKSKEVHDYKALLQNEITEPVTQ